MPRKRHVQIPANPIRVFVGAGLAVATLALLFVFKTKRKKGIRA